MATSTLTSLAILKVNWDHLGVDYVENFVPFIVELARRSQDKVISLPDMQRSMIDEFGLQLPQTALRMVISRAVKRGYVSRKDRVFYKVQEACDQSSFRETQDAVAATHERVVTSLCEYAAANHGKEWTVHDAEAVLLDFLADRSLSLLYDIAEGSSNITVSGGQQFVLGSFVEHIITRNAALLDDLTLLARGSLLANAMYLPDPGQIQKKFHRTTVYLDTSLLMFATGFAGHDRAAPCLELINLLAESKAKLKCFSDTRNELQGILDVCAHRLRTHQLRDAYGPTIEYFIESGKTSSDLELMSVQLPAKLRDLGITVVDRPSFEEFQFQIDEKGFEQHLDHLIRYTNPNARIHDVDCISAIARMRSGRETREVEECRAIFVTTNTLLARATRQFFQPDAAPGSVALAINSYALANLLWLKNPTAAPELPRKWIVAHAYAATQPPAGLWKKYLAEIASLEEAGAVTTDEYLLLRHSLSAKAALMDLTDGNEDTFAEGSIKDILEVANENVRADLTREVTHQHRRRIRTEESLRAAEESALVQRQRLRAKATSAARLVRNGIFWFFAAVLTYGVFITSPEQFPPIQTNWQAYIAPVVLFLVGVLTVCNLILGTTLRDLMDLIERKISIYIAGAFFSFVGIDPTGPLPDSEQSDNS